MLGKKITVEAEKEKYSLIKLEKYVSENLEHLKKFEIDDKRKEFRRQKIIQISKACGKGDLGAKLAMKNYITDLLTNSYGVAKENIDYIMDFDDPKNNTDKFDIILSIYIKEFNEFGLQNLVLKYELNKFRKINGKTQCCIMDKDIEEIYEKENITLSFEDKLNILVQRIYQTTKGLGVIDEMRDQSVNGISLGLDGIPIEFVGKLSEINIRNMGKKLKEYKMSYDSIWLNFKGKEICLDFLGFRSQGELERICKLMYASKENGQLTREDGFGFTYSVDLSRVSLFRPPFAEGWCLYLRKFDEDPEIDTLFNGENSEILKEFQDFAAKGLSSMAITGPQGAGKSTFLVAYIKRMYPNITLRLWEDFFEAFLRFKIPIEEKRNIMTIKSTDTIDAEKGVESLKKSNGDTLIISEVAEDAIIKLVIKISALVQSILLTHHANTAHGLVSAFIDGLINTGAATDEARAETAALRALTFNTHLYKGAEGERFPDRITEYVTFEDEEDENIFSNSNLSMNDTSAKKEEKLDLMVRLLARISISNKNKRSYRAVDIFRYDFIHNKYVVVNKISDKRKNDIMLNLHEEDKEKFKDFILRMEKQLEENKKEVEVS